MITLKVNGVSYLINEDSKGADEICKRIINTYPPTDTLEFVDGWELKKKE